MKVADILKLTAAGYKPADIKELSELEKSQPEAVQIAASGASLQDVKDLISLAATEEADSAEGADQGADESDPGPDYKSMYEELKSQTDKLQETLGKLQSDNSHKDLSGNTQKSLDEQVADIITNFM